MNLCVVLLSLRRCCEFNTGTATVPLSTRTVLETAADNSVIIPLIVTVTAVVIVYFILRRRGSRGR